MFLVVAMFPLIPMIISGRWDWWEACAYAIVNTSGFIASLALAARRHPGYAGALLAYLATPVLLDVIWAFIPVVLLVGVLFLRTALEDKTLQEELPGYKEYARKTPHRLLPGIW